LFSDLEEGFSEEVELEELPPFFVPELVRFLEDAIL